MKQRTLAMTTGFERYSKKTRRALFLEEMEQVVPWAELCALIEPFYPKAGNGRPPVGVERMLRIYFLQQWFNLSDPAVEEALYDSAVMRGFVGIDLGQEAIREWILVLLDVGTGLRMSELFGLKWKDVDFEANEISVVRSIVMQVTGPCKTEASQKPIPLDPCLAEALRAWRQQVRYNRPEDWIFASPRAKGRRPYLGQQIMRKVIRPIATQVGITKPIGWHTFRHTYSTLLRAARVDIKVMQEPLRHASSRVTMDTYTQAVTAQKREAQSGVVRLFRIRAMAPATEA